MRKKSVSKSKKELKSEFKSKGYHVKGHSGREKLTKEYNMELTSDVELLEEDRASQPKGRLQVLWKRGWIDATKISKYILKGKVNQTDKNSDILPECQHFVLCHLMSVCVDFKEEKLAIKVILQDLANMTLNNQKVKHLMSPKYHRKLAGEGEEYNWPI